MQSPFVRTRSQLSLSTRTRAHAPSCDRSARRAADPAPSNVAAGRARVAASGERRSPAYGRWGWRERGRVWSAPARRARNASRPRHAEVKFLPGAWWGTCCSPDASDSDEGARRRASALFCAPDSLRWRPALPSIQVPAPARNCVAEALREISGAHCVASVFTSPAESRAPRCLRDASPIKARYRALAPTIPLEGGGHSSGRGHLTCLPGHTRHQIGTRVERAEPNVGQTAATSWQLHSVSGDGWSGAARRSLRPLRYVRPRARFNTR